jgi:hypothetical protein
MKNEDKSSECGKEKFIFKNHHSHKTGGPGAIYFFGVVGALFYFLQGAYTFGNILLGIGKAIVWPALLMFRLLTYLKM